MMTIRPLPSPALSGTPWVSGPWFFRDERMYLFPGDSPMGYRLPLDSLPWVSKADFPYMVEQDPFAPRDSLPAGSQLRRYTAVSAPPATPAGLGLERFKSAHEVTRTALCVEVRDPRRANGPAGRETGQAEPRALCLHAAAAAVEDYLELLAAVEATTAELGVKIVLEGYPPPRDPRLKLLQVTPDPGVIEVNIHPAHRWDELVDNTEFLYEAARLSRLSSEKFMLDGRHTGTGGGNHFVLGGATPADSPFLRRPDLLASLLAYWHNHPVPELSVLGPLHRSDQPGPAGGRGAQRPVARAGDCAGRDRQGPGAAWRSAAALAGRPRAAQCAGRRDRQHPPQRVLHRQALLARLGHRPAGPAWSCAPSRCRPMRA